jgi:hypothetical protein
MFVGGIYKTEYNIVLIINQNRTKKMSSIHISISYKVTKKTKNITEKQKDPKFSVHSKHYRTKVILWTMQLWRNYF